MTSCNKAGYEQYGRRCVETLHHFWPLDMPLHVVSEELLQLPECIKFGRKLVYHNLFQDSVDANAFHVKYRDDPQASGRGERFGRPQNNRHWRSGYSFRHDAYKFSKKVFAIKLVADTLPGGRLIWLDADTVTMDHIPRDLLERMPPTGSAIACLLRGQYHSECGFVGYDLDNPATRTFLDKFAEIYSSGEVFKLPEWHDSWVFDFVRKRLQTPTWGIPFASRGAGHPFVFSELGKYIDHLKGARKDNGVSHDHPRYVRTPTEKIGRIVLDGPPPPYEMAAERPPGIAWHKSRGRKVRFGRR